MKKQAIVIRKVEPRSPQSSKAREDKKLNLNGEVTVEHHTAYFYPAMVDAFDIEGILEHEVLAIDVKRGGSVIYAFQNGHWEKRLYFEDIFIENYTVDTESNFYFLGGWPEATEEMSKVCIGCVDKGGNLVWCYACESDESPRPMESNQSGNGRDGRILFEQNRLLVLLHTYRQEGEYTIWKGARFRVMNASGELLAVHDISNYCKSYLMHYFVAINNEKIEILHCGSLIQFTLDGEYLEEKIYGNFDIQSVWRFDEKIVISAEWKNSDGQAIYGDVQELSRESEKMKHLETPVPCNTCAFYYDGKYYSEETYCNEQGEDVGKVSIEQEIGQPISVLNIISILGLRPVKDDFENIYLLPRLCYLPRQKTKLQRILMNAECEILKDDIFICEEKGMLDIRNVMYHHGKIYVVSSWETNKKERAQQAANLNVINEVMVKIPLEELDIYDLLKTRWSAKTIVTVISPK